jgi:sirohydrochlorin ferrochelatase
VSALGFTGSSRACFASKPRSTRLPAVFKAAGDDVSLLWMDFRLAGETDLAAMAQWSGRSLEDFNLAQQRGKRAVERLLAEDSGVSYDETEAMMPKPDALEIWRQLVDEAGEDEIDRAASVTVAQAEKDLADAGFDVAAERARAAALLRKLER